eukprot:FR742569.1.p1 GENE.FR742569.1~~FR742569.1.p1  ORF type:complete len:138 (+),score=6.36 FR742569.1:307-720(+)
MHASRVHDQIMGISNSLQDFEMTQRTLYLGLHLSAIAQTKRHKSVLMAWNAWKKERDHWKDLHRRIVVQFSGNYQKWRTTRLAMGFADLRAKTFYVAHNPAHMAFDPKHFRNPHHSPPPGTTKQHRRQPLQRPPTLI